jgi:putative membrane protein
MIVHDYFSLRRLWPAVSRRLGWLFLLGVAVTLLFTQLRWHVVSNPSLPLSMMGGALSIFLAFRNNSAYDRWWEARTLWGGLVNSARTLARQVLTLIDRPTEPGPAGEPAPGRHLIELQIAYVHALRCHLRGQNPFPELQVTLSPDDISRLRGQRNVPLALLLQMGQVLRRLYEAGQLDSYRFTTLDRTLVELCNVQGACERIKNTPLPRQYEYVPRVLVGVYCLLLPFGMVEGLGLLTPLLSTLVSFIFLSLESVGRDIENPFENTVHDTPMSALSRTIEINLRQHLGDRQLPAELSPVEGFVY